MQFGLFSMRALQVSIGLNIAGFDFKLHSCNFLSRSDGLQRGFISMTNSAGLFNEQSNKTCGHAISTHTSKNAFLKQSFLGVLAQGKASSSPVQLHCFPPEAGRAPVAKSNPRTAAALQEGLRDDTSGFLEH